jgi:hypothetical protein
MKKAIFKLPDRTPAKNGAQNEVQNDLFAPNTA